MEIDFSKLDAISKPTEAVIRDNLHTTNIETAEKVKDATGGTLDPLKSIGVKYRHINREKEDLERARQIYREYNDNRRKAGTLKGEINKAINAGEDITEILLKALECISLMTGEKLFYDINQKKLKKNTDW